MKTEKYKSLGLVVALSVPETVDEFDSNAKKAGACLAEGTNNVVYRGMLGDFRDVLIHGCEEDTVRNLPGFKGLEDIYGVPRKMKPSLGKDGKPKVGEDKEPIMTPDETEQEYVDRLIAEKSLKIEDLQSYADQTVATLLFDASSRERKAPKTAKLGEEFKSAATNLLANIDDTKINKTLSKFLPVEKCTFTRLATGGQDEATAKATTDKNVDVLGRLVKEYNKAKLSQGVL